MARLPGQYAYMLQDSGNPLSVIQMRPPTLKSRELSSHYSAACNAGGPPNGLHPWPQPETKFLVSSLLQKATVDRLWAS